MIGIWWKDQAGVNWLDLSEKEKLTATDKFFSRKKDSRDWSKVVMEL
jgi:hypothetical protein